ncbi:hypothetical protein LSM04_009615 [Trypanosoma melophagium]|uniref:uncharacterized protein n=1 Tax=Trypanosoma melophagium TaxID=715481 RepID=UPI00351AAABA|nr:hypothetical protein LSM04_009615 [Trypanosoma melophagium]
MDLSPLPDEDLGVSEVLWSPDLDARWRFLRRHISPFERDRVAYYSAKYQKPVFVYMNPIVWRRLVEKQGAFRAVELMLMLGFAPAPEGPWTITEWIEREAAATARNTSTTGSNAVFSSNSGYPNSRRPIAVPPGTGDDSRIGGGVRFFLLNHEDTRPSITGSPVSQYMSPRSSTMGVRAGSPAVVTMCSQVSSPVIATTTTTTATSLSSGAAVTGTHRVDGEPAVTRIRNLEAEVRELTRQIRILKSRELEQEVSTVCDVASQNESPQPHIIVRPDRPFIASTNCHALVCLPVNYLDPDCAPYVVSLGAASGRMLLACTIVEHRYVIFVAPPQRHGSLAVVLLCTREGTLRPYTRAVWLEYRAQDPPNTLTHHAVNQLLQEIPLPSSATAIDPNPSEMEQAKSESAFEDDNTFCDTDTAVSTSDHGLETEPRLPLTKEMLQLIPNGVIAGMRASRTAATSHIHPNDATLSVPESSGSSTGGEREAAAPTEQLWDDSRLPKRGSTTMSTGHPTSYQRGQQSGYSDEEATQHAFNCTTNHTDLSSSTATSVVSFESTTPSGGFGSAGIMVRRGWVRHCVPGHHQTTNTIL